MKARVQVLKTYSEARKIVSAFSRPHGLNFVLVIAPPGVGKTNTFYRQFCSDALLLQGGLSAVKLYCKLYEHRNKPVVFDDVDELFDTRAGVNLLKCLGQTDKEKLVSWEKASPVLAEEGVPTSFHTTSRILIFANTLKSVEANLGAVLDRAHAYRFAPSPTEIHREVKTWFADDEIFQFVDDHLPHIQTLSMRDYVKAQELKRAKLDWRKMLLNKWHANPKLSAMLHLLKEDLSPAQRQRQFAAQGLGSEATYKRFLAKANRLMRTSA